MDILTSSICSLTEGLSNKDLQRFLLLLHQLVPHLSIPRNRQNYGDDIDSDDEEDNAMDVDESVIVHVAF